MDGCWAHVGYRSGGSFLNLGLGCWTLGTAIHELGHALGMRHEQSRKDRDAYVKILWRNIVSGMEYNFDKGAESAQAEVPYDYLSIMHYDPRAFGKGLFGRQTIESKKGSGKEALMGQNFGLSRADRMQLRKLYNCKEIDRGSRFVTTSNG